ncbi:MAG: SDR family oxidoreductase [Rhizomicrobium sp.]
MFVRICQATVSGPSASSIVRTAFSPGLIFTDTIRAELPRATAEGIVKQQILPCEGKENDIVEALLFLVSSRSSFVTGETLRVSGGFALTL